MKAVSTAFFCYKTEKHALEKASRTILFPMLTPRCSKNRFAVIDAHLFALQGERRASSSSRGVLLEN